MKRKRKKEQKKEAKWTVITKDTLRREVQVRGEGGTALLLVREKGGKVSVNNPMAERLAASASSNTDFSRWTPMASYPLPRPIPLEQLREAVEAIAEWEDDK